MTEEKRESGQKVEISIPYIWAAFLILIAIVMGLSINALTSEVQNVRAELREIKGIMRLQIQR
jgi:hypothetical protein